MPDNTTITQFTWALTIADYVTDQRLGRLLATAVERYLSPTAEHADLTASLVPNYLILGALNSIYTFYGMSVASLPLFADGKERRRLLLASAMYSSGGDIDQRAPAAFNQ